MADGTLEALGPKKLHDLHGETISLTLMRSARRQNIRDLWFCTVTSRVVDFLSPQGAASGHSGLT